MSIINQVSGENFTAYHGDCVEGVLQIPSESIGFSVFSPPFLRLFCYSASDRDMGNCSSDEDFMQHFSFLSDQLFRVIKPGRCVAIDCVDVAAFKSRDGFIGLKDFPAMLRKCMENSGFHYHSKITIWRDPVNQMQRTKAIGLLYKQLTKDSYISRQGLPNYIVVLRKPGENESPIKQTISVLEWQKWASPVWLDCDNASDTLKVKAAREEKDEAHICPMQLHHIERLLTLWSNPGDVVLSPFMGIGSEGYVSIERGRKFIGFELKESYYQQAVRNLQSAEAKTRELSLF